jgi:hypothetical protein
LDHVAGVVSRLERATIGVPLAVLAAVFDRLGHHEPAATIAGFRHQSLHRSDDS